MQPKQPKSRLLQADIKRISRYISQHPGCLLKDVAEILNIPYDTVRKWKSCGFFEHETAAQIRARGGQAGPETIPNPLSVMTTAERQRRQRQEDAPPIGEVASSSTPAPASAVSIAPAADENIKVSTLRNQIKHCIRRSLHDAQAVSQYAAALKALAGVQDVELEEIYEQEKIIRIYCPAEETIPDHIEEVEPIEY